MGEIYHEAFDYVLHYVVTPWWIAYNTEVAAGTSSTRPSDHGGASERALSFGELRLAQCARTIDVYGRDRLIKPASFKCVHMCVHVFRNERYSLLEIIDCPMEVVATVFGSRQFGLASLLTKLKVNSLTFSRQAYE